MFDFSFLILFTDVKISSLARAVTSLSPAKFKVFAPASPDKFYSDRRSRSFLGCPVPLVSFQDSLLLFQGLLYKNSFLRKKIKPTTCGTWFGQCGKGISSPKQYGTKKLLPANCWELLLGPSVRIRGPNWRQEKLASKWVSSLASWIADKYFNQARSFLRNKTKKVWFREPTVKARKQIASRSVSSLTSWLAD